MDKDRRTFFLRVGAIIAFCTVLLTASFVGVLALVSGDIQNYQARVPYYILVGALTFVGTIVLLEEHGTHGRVIFSTAIVTTVIVLIIVTLAVEGAIFTIEDPEAVFVSQLVIYLLAAGLIGTGIGYWGLNHWREFTGNPRGNGGL